MGLPPGTRATGSGADVASAAKVAKGGHARLGHEDDVPAIAPIAAVRSPARDVGLAAEGPRPIAAAAGRHVDADVVSEHAEPMIATLAADPDEGPG
jgi:hypothetical protein